MHDNKVAHRDLKPNNIMVDTKVSPADPIIIDFGLSNTTMLRAGTPPYIAPE